MNAVKTGEFIRNLRNEKNMTQQELADMLYVSDKAISRWETGKGFPDIGNIESLADKLDVSVAEILKGERFKEEITEKDIDEVSSASFSLARNYVIRRKWLNLAAGFLCGMIIVSLLFIHLNSPIWIKNAESVVSVDVLSDGQIVAVLEDDVADYQKEYVADPDSGQKEVFLSCYKTLWHNITGSRNRNIVYLGDADDTDYVFYYPSDEGDMLIWKKDGISIPDFGVETLPRLLYNFWIMIGASASVVGIILCLIFRRKRFIGRMTKAVMVPVAFTLSMIAVLAGNTDTVYSAQYFLSGMVLIGILLYVLMYILYTLYMEKNGKRD